MTACLVTGAAGFIGSNIVLRALRQCHRVARFGGAAVSRPDRAGRTGDALTRLNLESGKFFLVTLHRAENVDDAARLEKLLRGLALVADTYAEPMVVSLHPRTADKLARFGLDPQSPRVRLLAPLGLFDFVKLEQRARCVLSDSGTVQEECSIFNAPNVTLRDVTERAETIEVGSNILTGAEPEMILRATRIALETSRAWSPPKEYVVGEVARTVVKVTLGYQRPAAA